MGPKNRPVPDVDQVTPVLEALLAPCTDEEIETGVIAPEGDAICDAERDTVAALLDRFNDARLK